MPLFNNWSDLEKHLTKQVSSVIEDDCASAIIEAEKSNIEKTVYGVYRPRKYKRRRNAGGLIANENFMVYNDDELSITVENVTPASLDYDGTDKNLPELIVKGHGDPWEYDYPHEGVAYMKSRDFVSATKEDLEQNKQHVKALKDGLEKRGVKTT